MEILKYLKNHSLEHLKSELGIVVKEQGNLLCFNYDQIESPKLHPIVLECRGLILEKDTYKIVFRSMDRFFNYREANTLSLDFSKADYFDKLDGSLIKMFCYQNNWHIATRGTCSAKIPTYMGINFEELVLKALKLTSEEFQLRAHKYLDPSLSYNFEITSRENRVVTKYEGYTLYYLNARDTYTGIYVDESLAALRLGAKFPTKFFKETPTIEEVFEKLSSFKNLEEGFVAYIDGVPQCKFKSPLYIEVHRKKFDCLTPGIIKRLVFEQEHEEYLAYFPEDERFFTPYLEAYEKMFKDVSTYWESVSHIKDQKEFASKVSQYPLKALLFSKKQDCSRTFYGIFNKQVLRTKYSQLSYYLPEGVL